MSTSKLHHTALRSGAALALLMAATGCASDDLRRGAGITDEAGNAIAHNTALQLVDPWPEGVEDTDLETPYDRGGEEVTPLTVPEKTSE